MQDKNNLLKNINKIHTTPMGKIRIKENLKLNTNDIVEFCKNILLNKNSIIYKKGKNYYCTVDNIEITINSYNFCIITAHVIK